MFEQRIVLFFVVERINFILIFVFILKIVFVFVFILIFILNVVFIFYLFIFVYKFNLFGGFVMFLKSEIKDLGLATNLTLINFFLLLDGASSGLGSFGRL